MNNKSINSLSKKLVIASVASIFVFVACRKESTPPPVVVACDVSNVSYASKIKPILIANCASSGCHDGNAQSDYNDTSVVSGSASDTTRILDRISRAKTAGGFMPQNSSLTDCDLKLLKEWIRKGGKVNN